MTQATAQEFGLFEFKCFDKNGNLKWEETAKNWLANDGQQLFLDVVLRGAANVAGFYLGLCDNSSPASMAKDQTLAQLIALGEPTGNGYSRIAIEKSNVGWPTLALYNGDFMATSKTVTFTSSGTIGPVNVAFITDAASGTTGKHISSAGLLNERTLANGESLQVTYKIQLV